MGNIDDRIEFRNCDGFLIMKTLKTAIYETKDQPVEQLEEIRDQFEPTEDNVAELIRLLNVLESFVQSSSAWLLRQYLEQGRLVLSKSQVAQIGRALKTITDPWAALHICQMMRHIPVPTRNADQFARFIRSCINNKNTFVRAWSFDAFYRLASQHKKYLAEARMFLEQGENDKAASIRARIRNIRKEAVEFD